LSLVESLINATNMLTVVMFRMHPSLGIRRNIIDLTFACYSRKYRRKTMNK